MLLIKNKHMKEIYELLLKESVITLQKDIEYQYHLFIDALKKEEDVLNTEKESFLLSELVNLDTVRIKMYNGIYSILKSKRNEYEENKLQSSRRLLVVYEKYKNPTLLPYNDETAILDSIISEFETKLFKDIETLELSRWLSCFRNANTNFDTLMSQNRIEYLEHETIPSKIARIETDLAFKNIVDMLYAENLVQGKALYEEIIVKLNKILTIVRGR